MGLEVTDRLPIYYPRHYTGLQLMYEEMCLIVVKEKTMFSLLEVLYVVHTVI